MKKQSDKLKYWSALILSWKQSGLSQDKFCKKNKLNISTFHYWRKKLARLNKSNFVHVKLVEKPKVAPPIVRNLPNAKWLAEVLLEMSVQMNEEVSR